MSSANMSQSPCAARAAWIIILLTATHFVAFTLLVHINHDVAWILQGAMRMLQGAEFGRDIIDVNPPLAWWLSLPAAWLAEVSGMPPALAFRLQVLVMVVLALWLAGRRNPSLAPWQLAAMAALLLIAPGYHFGQREHLMVILALPYLAAPVAAGNLPLRLVAGVLAGLAFSLKPYFLAIPLLVELWLLTTQRRLALLMRAELLAMAATGLAYVLTVAWLAPAYLFEVIPGAMVSYGAYATPFAVVVQATAMTILPLLGSLALLWLAGGRDHAAIPFLLALAGAIIALLLQSKGWAYHRLPSILFGLIAVLLMLKPPVASALRVLALMLALLPPLALNLPYWFGIARPGSQEEVIDRLAAAMRSLPPPRRVFAFNTSPRVIHSAVLAANARWAGDACCLYALPAAVRFPSAATRREAERQLSRLLARWRTAAPQLIIVDDTPRKLGFAGQPFDWLDHLRRHKRFATFLQDYETSGRIGHYLLLRPRRLSRETPPAAAPGN